MLLFFHKKGKFLPILRNKWEIFGKILYNFPMIFPSVAETGLMQGIFKQNNDGELESIRIASND